MIDADLPPQCDSGEAIPGSAQPAGIWGLGLVGIRTWGSVDTVWGFRAQRGVEADLIMQWPITTADNILLDVLQNTPSLVGYQLSGFRSRALVCGS
jgi:hypothetical protein